MLHIGACDGLMDEILPPNVLAVNIPQHTAGPAGPWCPDVCCSH